MCIYSQSKMALVFWPIFSNNSKSDSIGRKNRPYVLTRSQPRKPHGTREKSTFSKMSWERSFCYILTRIIPIFRAFLLFLRIWEYRIYILLEYKNIIIFTHIYKVFRAFLRSHVLKNRCNAVIPRELAWERRIFLNFYVLKIMLLNGQNPVIPRVTTWEYSKNYVLNYVLKIGF